MALGDLLVLAGYILASLANDTVVQSGARDVIFGEIACRELAIINGEGNKSVVLNTPEYAAGHVIVFGKDGGAAQLDNNEDGGAMPVFNKAGESVLQVGVGNRGEGIIKTKNGVRNFDDEVAEPTLLKEQ